MLKMSVSCTIVREKGLEPSRPKTQVPKTCVSAISPLPLTHFGAGISQKWIGSKIRGKLGMYQNGPATAIDVTLDKKGMKPCH